MAKYLIIIILLLGLVVLLNQNRNINSNLALAAQQEKTSVIKGILNLETSTFIIPDDNVLETKANATLTPTTSFIRIDCQDPDGCNTDVSESGRTQGDFLVLLNVSPNRQEVIIQGETPEAAVFNIQYWATAYLIYEGTSWIVGP